MVTLINMIPQCRVYVVVNDKLESWEVNDAKSFNDAVRVVTGKYLFEPHKPTRALCVVISGEESD